MPSRDLRKVSFGLGDIIFLPRLSASCFWPLPTSSLSKRCHFCWSPCISEISIIDCVGWGLCWPWHRLVGWVCILGVTIFEWQVSKAQQRSLGMRDSDSLRGTTQTQLKVFSAGWDVKSFEEDYEKYRKMYDDVRLGRETRRERSLRIGSYVGYVLLLVGPVLLLIVWDVWVKMSDEIWRYVAVSARAKWIACWRTLSEDSSLSAFTSQDEWLE